MDLWEYEEVLDEIDEVLELCDQVEEIIEKPTAQEFATSVRTQVLAIQSNIETFERVSPKQASAIDNWQSGLMRWLEPGYL